METSAWETFKSPARPSSARRRRKERARLRSRSPRPVRKTGEQDDPRASAALLSALHSTDELDIDHSRTLSVKRGDLSIFQGESFRCSPRAPGLAHVPLVVRRVECVDRRAYDLKVYEADSFQRFREHPNVTSLHSYWSEPARSDYSYKTLVLLLQDAVGGDMLTYLRDRRAAEPGWRPSPRDALRMLCDAAKGLVALHSCNMIHGRVKPSALLRDAEGTVMLGELGKVELDAARQTHHYFSKVLIGDAIPEVLVYWAPELLRLEAYDTAVDLWALGVSVFQMVTGELPFPTGDESSFRAAVLSGGADVDWSLLDVGYPRVAAIVRRLLVDDPAQRLTAHDVLAAAQHDFATDLQRVWSGYRTRRELREQADAAVKMQALYRGHSAKRVYASQRDTRRDDAAVALQASFRGFKDRSRFQQQKAALERCQANVLARQQTARFAFLKANAGVVQTAARTYLAQRWRDRLRDGQHHLEIRLRDLQRDIEQYANDAADFAAEWPDGRLPPHARHLASVEAFQAAQDEWSRAESGASLGASGNNGAASNGQANDDAATIKELRGRLADAERRLEERTEEEKELRAELGPKYAEYRPMVERVRRRLAKLGHMCAEAEPLELALAHEYSYSAWDRAHEPDNVADNALFDDDREWKALAPTLDVALSSGARCFVAAVELHVGDCGPSSVAVSLSANGDTWDPYQQFDLGESADAAVHRLELRGEPTARYLRLHMPDNVRGGQYVAVRHVVVRGLVLEEPRRSVGGGYLSRSSSRGSHK